MKCCQPTQTDLRNEWELKTEKEIINGDVIAEAGELGERARQ